MGCRVFIGGDKRGSSVKSASGACAKLEQVVLLHTLNEGMVEENVTELMCLHYDVSKDIAIVDGLMLAVTRNEALVHHYELHTNIIFVQFWCGRCMRIEKRKGGREGCSM